MKNGKIFVVVVILAILAGGLLLYFQKQAALEKSKNAASVFQPENEEIPAFLEFVKREEWYSHKIVHVDQHEEKIIVLDGLNHKFELDFDFVETHLREHHGLGSYIDEMGLYGFLVFVMENNLYQHRIDTIVPDKEVVIIKGDEGTDFETTFEMTFDNIIKHMRLDHKWTNQELSDAHYCQKSFGSADKVDDCVKKLQ